MLASHLKSRCPRSLFGEGHREQLRVEYVASVDSGEEVNWWHKGLSRPIRDLLRTPPSEFSHQAHRQQQADAKLKAETLLQVIHVLLGWCFHQVLQCLVKGPNGRYLSGAYVWSQLTVPPTHPNCN